MTRLRVLSGLHAGISIDWLSSQLVVGASEELDVYIGDWNAQQLELRRDAQGRCWACWSAAGQPLEVLGQQRADDGFICLLQAWVPVRFGAVILCVGPADQDWPDDAQLLQRCFVPPPPADATDAPDGLDAAAVAHAEPAAAPGRARGRRLLVSAAACGMLVVAAPAAMQRPTSLANASVPPHVVGQVLAPMSSASAASLAASAAISRAASSSLVSSNTTTRLRQMVGAQALEGVTLEATHNRVIVRGVLASRSAVDDLNRALNALPTELLVSRRFVAAQDVVDRLHESLSTSRLTVQHLQGPLFEVSGRVADPARTGAAIEHIAADLAELGVQIRLNLRPRQDALPAVSGLLVDGQGVSFLRTRDGVKHIVAAAPPRATAREAASAPASSLSNRAPGAGATP